MYAYFHCCQTGHRQLRCQDKSFSDFVKSQQICLSHSKFYNLLHAITTKVQQAFSSGLRITLAGFSFFIAGPGNTMPTLLSTSFTSWGICATFCRNTFSRDWAMSTTSYRIKAFFELHVLTMN